LKGNLQFHANFSSILRVPEFQGSSQKSLVIKIFAVGHRKIIDFPALAKNDKQLSFLQRSGAFLPQFNPKN